MDYKYRRDLEVEKCTCANSITVNITWLSYNTLLTRDTGHSMHDVHSGIILRYTFREITLEMSSTILMRIDLEEEVNQLGGV